MSRTVPVRFALSLLAAVSLAGACHMTPDLEVRRDGDRDGDGLSDFHEVHKHLTDPDNADSDGDGIPDGDWLERREYQYTVRTIVQVMRPVTIGFLTDDHQDARVLDETDDYVELEVVHYPFTTVADDIPADAERTPPADAARWLAPGPTSNWDPELRAALLAAMQEELSVDATELDDKALVETAAKWLCGRTKNNDSFTAFATAFDDRGAPFIPDELRPMVDGDDAALAEQWQRDVLAKGMFEHRRRGSCTSSAIYLSGCLKALGVPTRTILTIPLVDANDERELAMAERGITHHELRRTVLPGLRRLKGSWASHTFNEVWVGGRWRRLNYDRLGQGIVDRQLFGMITHVATFADWADARMPETIGRRQALRRTDDVFGGPNPYSTITLRDEFGPHCTLANPEPEPVDVEVTAVAWGDGDDAPEFVRAWVRDRGHRGLIARVEGPEDYEALKSFLDGADKRVWLRADGAPQLGVGFHPGAIWWRDDHAWIFVPFGAGDCRDHDRSKRYRFVCRNDARGSTWKVAEGVVVKERASDL